MLSDADLAGEQVLPSNQPAYVMPLASVLVSASVGLLTFLSYGAGSANTVFNWLVNVASVASLQSWAGMLFTYIRCVRSAFIEIGRCGHWIDGSGGKVAPGDGVLRAEVEGRRLAGRSGGARADREDKEE